MRSLSIRATQWRWRLGGLLLALVLGGCLGDPDAPPGGPGPSTTDAIHDAELLPDGATGLEDTAPEQLDAVDVADTLGPPDDSDTGGGDSLPGDDADAAGAPQWTVTQLTSPLGEDQVFKAIWGVSDHEAYVVGVSGTILSLTADGVEVVASEPEWDILNAIHGVSSSDAWIVGMQGLAMHFDGEAWGAEDACTDDGACDDGDPCTSDECVDTLCAHTHASGPGCCGGVLYEAAFDDGTLQGFTVEDLYASDAINGGIVFNVASHPERYTSEPYALYFGIPDKPCPGDPEAICQDYDNGTIVGSLATSPPFAIPSDAVATLSFMVFIDTESSSYYDQLTLWVVDVAGASQQVWEKADIGGTTGGQFVEAAVDLAPWQGRTIQLQLRFDSVDNTVNSGDGVYVDDILVTSTCTGTGGGITWPTGTDATLWAVWGAADDDYYAAGGQGTILHYDGQTWQEQMGGSMWTFLDVEGDPVTGDMAAVGASGVLLERTDGKWQPGALGTAADLWGTWRAPDGTLFLVGSGGTILRGDGGVWSPMEPPAMVTLFDVDGVTSDDVWAVGAGGAAFHYDGAAWSSDGPGVALDLYGVWIDDTTGEVMAVGESGAAYLRASEGGWTDVSSYVPKGLYRVWGTAMDDLFVVGQDGTALYRSASGWEAIPTGTSKVLNGVWGTSGADVYAVGLTGTLLHYDGLSWQAVDLDTLVDLYGVWGRSADEVYVVGAGGVILAGSAADGFDAIYSTTVATLRDLYGTGPDDVMAVGANATIMHNDGKGWAQMTIPPVPLPDGEEMEVTQHLHGVWGSSPTDYWAVGEAGTLLTFDGEAWTYGTTGSELTLRGVSGNAEGDVFAVGAGGSVFHLSGEGVTSIPTGTVATLYDVWSPVQGKAFVVGDMGTLLFVERTQDDQ